MGWFHLEDFDTQLFNEIRQERVASWIIPCRFLALCDPIQPILDRALTQTGQSIPEDDEKSKADDFFGNEELIEAVRDQAAQYKTFFRENNIKLLVRLNDATSGSSQMQF